MLNGIYSVILAFHARAKSWRSTGCSILRCGKNSAPPAASFYGARSRGKHKIYTILQTKDQTNTYKLT
jgi:hypothetical protein